MPEQEFLKVNENKEVKTVDKHPAVEKAVELLMLSKQSPYRVHAMDNIAEDKDLYQSLTDSLSNEDAFARLNNTVLMQVIRLVSEDSHSLPDATPISAQAMYDDTMRALLAIKRKYEVEGELRDKMRDVIKTSSTIEGTSFLRILPESYSDLRKGEKLTRLNFARVDSAKTFYDPNCISNVRDGDWVCFREEYSNSRAIEIAKSIYGYTDHVSPGDILSPAIRTDETGDDEMMLPETTAFYTMFHKTTATYLVFAGENGALLQILVGGKYPVLDKFGYPDIPVYQYDATVFKKGIHATSYIGVAKDIAREKLRQFNSILPQMEKIGSPMLVAFGAISTQQLADEIADATELQAQGLSGILNFADSQARLDRIFPEDITPAFERINNIMDNELSKRLGLNLNIQEKNVTGGTPTATQIIEQGKEHAKAIANQNKINIQFYKGIYNGIINYARTLLKGDKSKIKVGINDSDYVLTGNVLLLSIEDWRGDWEIDTSVELNITRDQKILLMDEEIRNLTGMTQLLIMSMAEIKPIKDLVWGKLRLRQLDNYIQKQELDEYFQAIIDKNAQAQEREVEQKQAKETGARQKGASATTPADQVQAANLGAVANDTSGGLGV